MALNYKIRKYFVNPKIIYREGIQISKEACGSIEGIWCEIERSKIIKVEYYNFETDSICVDEYKDTQACIMLHEIDHLNCVFIDDIAIKIHKLEIK